MNVMKTLSTLALTLALLAHGAVALAADSTSQYIKRDAPKGITAKFYTCIDNAGSDTIAMAACLTTERAGQDARLNRTYKALLGKLKDKSAKDELISAQRTWLEFHSKTGGFESAIYGSERVSNLQIVQNEIFRLCERANALDKYLEVVNDQ